MNRYLSPIIASLTLLMASLDRTPTTQATEAIAIATESSTVATAPHYTIQFGDYEISFFADGLINIAIPGQGTVTLYPDGTYNTWADGNGFSSPELVTTQMILWILFLVGYVAIP